MTETKGLRAEAGDAGGTGRVCVVLLPGLDGTGVLFRPFLQACPEHVTPVVIDFPRDERLDYAELEQHVVDRLPTADRTVIVGESFSGPLALRVAARRPAGLIGVVLCASFVRPPGACWLACLPWRLLLRLRAPDVLLRRLLTGREKAAELVPLVREALGRVQPSVLAHRMKLLRHLDADRELTECPAPVLYLRGSEDRLVKEKSLTEIRDICPDAVVHTVRAPHLVLQCAPQEAWNAVTSFLAAPPSPGSGPARVATASPYGSLIHYSPPATGASGTLKRDADAPGILSPPMRLPERGDAHSHTRLCVGLEPWTLVSPNHAQALETVGVHPFDEQRPFVQLPFAVRLA